MPDDTTALGPMQLRPIFQERIWGVDSLGPWYPAPQPGKPVGEAWLTAEQCTVDSGPLGGESLAEAVRRYPKALGGGDAGQFPLLIKTLFPREKLSVQVHPNDAEAQAMGDPRGKTECWYVLSAEPGAEVALGFHEDVSTDEVRAAIGDGTLESRLRYVPVKAGDMVFVDAGTVHAIGPGMVVLETQQYSDTTFRLYDYGRPRELHVDQGLAVTRTATQAGLTKPQPMDGFMRLVSSAYFVVDRFALSGREPAKLGKRGALQLLVALDDGCFVENEAGERTHLQPGAAVLLPAEAVSYRLAAEGQAEVIRIAER